MPKRKSLDEQLVRPPRLRRPKRDPIKAINALPFEEFQHRFESTERVDSVVKNVADTALGPLSLTLKPSSGLDRGEVDQCLGLIKQSSHQHYEGSSFGWHPSRKRREMLEAEMRYYLIKDIKSSTVQGFLSFMFTHDSTPSVPVLYIYEIHLAPPLRGRRVGQHLMQVAEDVAVQARVEKVMLTCFLANAPALDFYRGRGYAVDECSPADRTIRSKLVKVDYKILSRVVEQSSLGG